MEKAKDWKRLGELSRMLQLFRNMYVHRQVEEDHPPLLDWRRELVDFLKGLLLSCELLGAREDNQWVHFRFEGPLSKVLGHSFCDWSSPDAFGCGLMSEMLQALLQVQSELPVCTTAIVHVLLHRLASIRPGKETRGPFFELVSGLQSALDACPAMPGVALGASIEDCLRRPSPGAASWSLGTTRMFVGGALSLVSRSPRSLCQAVVTVLVRFIAERGCGITDESLAAGAEEEQEPCPRSPCVSCAAAGVATGAQAVEKKKGTSQPLRCEAQEKRDLVLEGMLRWAVDVHFRRCSGLLQASLSRAVCDGVRQALDAAELSPGGGRTPLGGRRTPPPPCFPLGCRLLLSFVGGLAGDGGARAAAFLQERCGAELRLFLARAHRRFGPPSSSASGGGHNASAGTLLAKKQRRRRRPELPVLNAYVGHLCLCRHVSDSLAGRHLVWLARQGLAVLRLLDRQDDVASGATTNTDPTRPEWEEIATELLAALTYALALLLTRPKRDVGCASLTTAVPENAGNVLEIVFDSDARPLSGVPIRLAEAAIGVLKEAGHLQLVRSEELLRPPPPPPTPVRPGGGSRGRGASTFAGHLAPPGGSGGGGGDDDDARVVVREKKTAAPVATAGGGGGGGSGVSDAYSFASDGIEFVRASVAFGSSWSLAAAGLDPQLPVLRARKRGLAEVIDGDDQDDDDSDAGSENGGSMAGNGWGWVPDEVTLRVFSFMTPKRVCRLACVDRAWRELLAVSRVWRPFFEARWPVMDLDSKEDLEGVSSRLLLEGQVRGGGEMKKKPRRKRVKTGVVRWRIPVVGQDASGAQPSPDWMVLYRDRHRAERAARWKFAAKTNFAWLVCPFLGCLCSLKSEFAVKRHLRTHKRPVVKGRVANNNKVSKKAPEKGGTVLPATATATATDRSGRP